MEQDCQSVEEGKLMAGKQIVAAERKKNQKPCLSPFEEIRKTVLFSACPCFRDSNVRGFF